MNGATAGPQIDITMPSTKITAMMDSSHHFIVLAQELEEPAQNTAPLVVAFRGQERSGVAFMGGSNSGHCVAREAMRP